MTRRHFLKLSAAGVGLGMGVGFYTARVEPHWLELVERRLPITNLPGGLAGCRLAQLSDLHIVPFGAWLTFTAASPRYCGIGRDCRGPAT